MTTADTDAEYMAAEYAAAADAWRAFCKLRKTRDLNLAGQPPIVLLLAAFCEPPREFTATWTGDLLADVLAGIRTFVRHLDLDGDRGGSGGAFLNGYDGETLVRMLDAVIMLRRYERAYQERAAREPAHGGAP